MSVEEFFSWAEGREGRYELDGGHIVAMAPETARHGRVKGAIFRALADAMQADGSECEAFVDSIAVRVDASTAYIPDVLIECGERVGDDDRETRAPVVVVEVLSPSTAYRDSGVKLIGYFSLASLFHYVIVDPVRRRLVHHRRGEGDVIETRIIGAGNLMFDPPGIVVSVENLFGPSS